MEQVKKLYFILSYSVKELRIAESSLPLVFNFNGSNGITVIIEKNSKYSDKTELGESKCSAIGCFKVSNDVIEILEKVNKSVNPFKISIDELIEMHNENTTNPIKNRNKEIYNEIQNIPFSWYPDSFKDRIDQIRNELFAFIRNTIDVLRWRYSRYGNNNPLINSSIGWSNDKKSWKFIPRDIHIKADSFSEPPVEDNAINEIVNIIKQNYSEPMGHQLYREAHNLQFSNPRSGLIMVITALEIGTKEFLYSIVPDASWLIFNLPSPPIIKIVSDYLPLLPVKNRINGEIKLPPGSIMKNLKDGIFIRNGIIHKGESLPDFNKTCGIFHAVKDMLWLFDYYSGFDWAFNYISLNVREELLKEK